MIEWPFCNTDLIQQKTTVLISIFVDIVQVNIDVVQKKISPKFHYQRRSEAIAITTSNEQHHRFRSKFTIQVIFGGKSKFKWKFTGLTNHTPTHSCVYIQNEEIHLVKQSVGLFSSLFCFLFSFDSTVFSLLELNLIRTRNTHTPQTRRAGETKIRSQI